MNSHQKGLHLNLIPRNIQHFWKVKGETKHETIEQRKTQTQC